MEGKIKLGTSIVGDTLFQKLKDSEYMKRKGYKILYASSLCKPKIISKMAQGVEVEETVNGEPIEHRLCYYNKFPKTPYYVHIHDIKPSEEMSELHYWITLGDRDAILKDLINLVKEIEGKEILANERGDVEDIIKTKEGRMEENALRKAMQEDKADEELIWQLVEQKIGKERSDKFKEFCETNDKEISNLIDLLAEDQPELMFEAMFAINKAWAKLLINVERRLNRYKYDLEKVKKLLYKQHGI